MDMFSVKAMVTDLTSQSKSEVLDEMVTAAVTGGLLPKGRKGQVIEALEARESRGSTGFGRGIAIPHAKIEGLRKHAGVIARSVGGLDFRAIDGEPVHVLVMLISPESRTEDHLEALRWLSVVARDPDFTSFIRQARTPEDMLDVLQERAD
jgi:mannitol/fructose-specific phosphotransferase system IIA component (Ntr-type)